MFRSTIAVAGVGAALLSGCQQASVTVTDSSAGPQVIAASDIEAGRYVVLIGGCNDCHTPQYAVTGGAQPPESEWLQGSNEGHTGPWGTSYGKNLRLTVAGHSEDEWVQLLSTGSSLPPMPWPSVRAMSDADKRAVYRYIKSMPGDPGQPAPPPLPPGTAPTTPPAV
ncbi:cytochrome c [Brevundimonas sp.]|uniref:cytochrome c n=1 Tax=Brevundimonas sp. TaxID=1871086 RepID=UPI0026211A4D|nr:cytochrome c [Brevundimonas sp.]